MKRYVAPIFLLLVTPLLVSCMLTGDGFRGSGDMVTNDYDLTDFAAVEVGWGCDLDIRAGDDYRVVVEIDDNLEEYLEVEVRDGTLTIGLDRTRSFINADVLVLGKQEEEESLRQGMRRDLANQLLTRLVAQLK